MTGIYIPRLIIANTNGNPMELMMHTYNCSVIYQTGNDDPKAARKIMGMK